MVIVWAHLDEQHSVQLLRGEGFYRIEIDGEIADFAYETGAAINALQRARHYIEEKRTWPTEDEY